MVIKFHQTLMAWKAKLSVCEHTWEAKLSVLESTWGRSSVGRTHALHA